LVLRIVDVVCVCGIIDGQLDFCTLCVDFSLLLGESEFREVSVFLLGDVFKIYLLTLFEFFAELEKNSRGKLGVMVILSHLGKVNVVVNLFLFINN